MLKSFKKNLTPNTLHLTPSRGFTLIELMTVIAIIVILTAIVLPNLNAARIKGRDAKRISDLKSIQLALAVYYDSHRSTGYPLSLDALVSSATSYLPSMPKDPQLNSSYIYSALGSGTFCDSYHLGAIMEGSAASGSDDNDITSLGTACTRAVVSGSGESATTGAVFNGNATNCLAGSTVSPDKCYDVKP